MISETLSNHSILLSTKRGKKFEISDNFFWGSVFISNKNKIIYSNGQNIETIVFMRSLAKPLQSAVLCDCNIINDYKLTPEELAIFQGSHSGSPTHIKLLKNILKKHNLKEEDLILKEQQPLDLEGFKGKISKLHNNCSGKHVMMLLMCKYLNLQKNNYTNPNHPLQRLIYKKQEELSNSKSNILTYDGCSTPLWGLSYQNIINAYYNLIQNEKYSVLINSIMDNPQIYGGNNRFDSEIIELSSKKLFAKVGGGGFILVYNLQKNEILLIKLAQNNNKERKLITFDILNKLNWLKIKPQNFELNQLNQKVAKYCYEFKFEYK